MTLNKLIKTTTLFLCSLFVQSQVVFAQTPKTYLEKVWSTNCDSPNGWGVLWTDNGKGTLKKIIHDRSGSAKIFEVKSYGLSDSGFSLNYHDYSETYVYDIRDGAPTIRVKNRKLSGRIQIENYKMSDGRFSAEVYLCDDEDPKAMATLAYSKTQPLKNEVNEQARAYKVLLDIDDVSELLDTFNIIEVKNKFESTDWVYDNSQRFSAAGLNESHLDSSAEATFGYEIDIKVDAYRKEEFAETHMAYERSRINGSGEFATRPVPFPYCGEGSLGSRWKSFSPKFLCQVESYVIEVSVGAFDNTKESRLVAEQIMILQSEKIKEFLQTVR